MRQSARRMLKDYGFALLCLAVAFFIAYEFPIFRERGLYGLLLGAISLAAWRGGFGPALMALAVAVFVTAWWVLKPADSLRMSNPADIVRLVVFIVVALLISSLHAARSRAERSLHESDQRLGFALESSGVGCWDADITAGRFWKSGNLASIYRHDPTNFATTYEGFFAYIHPEDRDFFRLASIRPGERGRDYEISHRICCGDGSIRRVNTRGRMYLDESGNVIRMVGTVYELESPAVVKPLENSRAAQSGLVEAAG